MADNYFAAEPSDVLAKKLEERRAVHGRGIDNSGLYELWLRSYRYYYGRQFSAGSYAQANNASIKTAGEHGELKLLQINHYRNLLKHILILTTNQKPSFDVRAINSDTDSLNQAKLGTSILDAYMHQKRLFRYFKAAAEQALVFGKGFVHITWEPSLGEEFTTSQYMDDDGQLKERIEYEGDVDVCNPSVFDVVLDRQLDDFSRAEWCLIRLRRNKYNLAARYVALKDRIEALDTEKEFVPGIDGQNIDDNVNVWVYAFYHRRTDAMPNGRFLYFCSPDVILYDGPIPYKRLPLLRIVPGEIYGTTEGYTDGFDLMGPQEAINTLASTVFSNESAFGLQNILIPEGCNLTPVMLAEGLRGLGYNPAAGEPKPLQLTATPAEIFKFFELLERSMETLSGVNSVARGNPDAQMGKNSSGAAMALIQSMAVQYASGFQQSWAELLEDGGTFILDLLKTFAKTERMFAMAGKYKRGAMQSFTGEKIQAVDRAVVELGNPMAKTTAGRVALADNLLDKGMVKTPQEYITVQNTGQLDPVIQGPEAELGLIHKENDFLLEGQGVRALVGDAHLLHAQEHRAIINDPDLRAKAAAQDPVASKVVQSALEHIQEHMQLYQSQAPFWSAVSGEPPAPQPPPPPQGGPPGPPGGPPNGPMPPPPGPPPPVPGNPAQPPPAPPPGLMAPNPTPQPGPV